MSDASICAGDHVWVQCIGYAHHGIASSANTVIHYLGKKGLYKDGKIVETTLYEFAEGSQVHVKEHTERRHNRSESVLRARQRMGEAKYNLVFNNCEHFVTWCIEDEHTSEQVNSMFRKSGQAVAAHYALRSYQAWLVAQEADKAYRVATFARTAAAALKSGSAATSGARAVVAGIAGAGAGGATVGLVSGGTTVAGIVAGAASAPLLLPLAVSVGAASLVYAGWKALVGDD